MKYAFVVLIASLAAAQTPVKEFGEIDGARFRIDIPAKWNGGLIMFAHGYMPPESQYRVPGEEGGSTASGALLIDIVIAQGYAMAQSGFSAQGFAMREGALETEALRHYFVRKYGKTYPTIIMGVHNGGLITYDVIERFPESYNGAIAIGGIPMPKLEWGKERLFDMRVLFDYYFPGLPGSAVDFPDHVTWASVREQAKKLVDQHPERAKSMLRMFNLRNTDELWRCLGLYTSILKDLNRNRAHGNAFDNRNTIYRGSDDDAQLNREIPRYKSDPKAVEYLKQWSSPNCRISSPVLAINSLKDPVVPSQDTHYYAEACERQGKSDLFVQWWQDSDAPLPGAENLGWTVRTMDDWIRNGKRPKPGELVEKPAARQLLPSAPAAPITEEEAFQIGVEAYVYGFPVYEMYRTRQPNAVRGLNQFNHRRALSGPEARTVVAPNNDTLYSSAWLDLAGGPLILDVPDTSDRYYCMQFMDTFTNNFAYVGRRSTGTKAGRYLIAGPQWKGQAPPGLKLIQATTNTVWLLGRFLVNDDTDLPSVHALQDQLKLTPLGTAAARSLPVGPNPNDALDFFTVVNAALDENPGPASEAALMKRFARIGVGPLRAQKVPERTEDVARGLRRAVDEGKSRVKVRSAMQDTVVNGWNVWRSPNIGHWGDDYPLRAAVAMQGLAANDRQENTSSVGRADSEGRPFDGTKHYTIRFSKGSLPPVDAFWSITMYDADYFMVPNAAKRYAIGDRTKGLKMQPDGSLEIYIQAESPGADKESNWLPSPAGVFYLALRCYQPRQAILDGTYQVPPVKRTA